MNNREGIGMLGKLLLKIVFKASLPIVAVAGVLSYGLYLKGGDPMSMWSTVASRTVSSIKASGANTVQSAQALASNGSSSKTSRKVYRWKDADGITHYSSSPAIGVAAKSITINTSTPAATTEPNRAAALPSGLSEGRSVDESSAMSPEDGQNLPGMAGMKLPVNISAEDLGMTNEELLKLIGQ